MSLMSLMPKSLNPAMQAAENRTLGLPAAQAPQAAAPAAGTDPATAAAAASGEGASQASLGAGGVQGAPPQPSKIIISSVLRGAVSGAGLMFGLNSFGPKIPFIAKLMTKAVGIIGLKFPMGTLVALGAGAVIGGVFGFLGGMKKARKAAADYAAAQAAQPPADPNAGAVPGVGLPPADPNAAPPTQPVEPPVAPPAPKKSKKVKKNPVMGPDYKGTSKRSSKGAKSARARKLRQSGEGADYKIKSGDTLWALSRKHGCSIQDIVDANAKIKDPNLIYAGDTIVIPGATT